MTDKVCAVEDIIRWRFTQNSVEEPENYNINKQIDEKTEI